MEKILFDKLINAYSESIINDMLSEEVSDKLLIEILQEITILEKI